MTGDYDALRHSIGAIDLGREVVRATGPDAVSFLQGQCSQDVDALAVGASADALLLTPQGKLDALVRVTRIGDDDVIVDVDAGYGEAVVTRLSRFKLRVKVEITLTDWSCVALRGPDAARVAAGDLLGTTLTPGTGLVVPFAWNGVVGVDLLGVDPEIPAGVRHCDTASWESLRVESGIPVMGAELDERTIAAEADLLERCVSFTKGCYTGQELVARLDSRGNKVARRLRGLVMEPNPDPSGPPTPGADVVVGDKVVGRLTSVAWSPTMEKTVALAYLHRDVEPPSPVTVRCGDPAEGDIQAQARTLPLVD